jgi:hypothetical protein
MQSEGWAQSLLKRLVTTRLGSSSSGERVSQVDACTNDLSALLRRMQVTNAASRPGIAQSLRPDVVNSLDRLTSSTDANVVSSRHDPSNAMAPAMRSQSMRMSISQLSGPDDVHHDSSFAESCLEYHPLPEQCGSWGDPSDSCTVAGEEIRMQEFFPTDATFVNAKVKELFFQREIDGNNKVRALCDAMLSQLTRQRFKQLVGLYIMLCCVQSTRRILLRPMLAWWLDT